MKKILVLLLFASSAALFAQQPKDTLNTEIIQVVKPYEPKISDAFKIETHPQTDTEVVPKDSISYEINSVPVASTFTPAKGKAKGVTRAKKERLYDNYISVGFGNYTSPLFDAYLRTFPSRDAEIGAILYHHSSQGGIKDVKLDDKFYDTKANLYYKQEGRYRDFKIDLLAHHAIYNWYGMPDDQPLPQSSLDSIDTAHTYFYGGATGTLTNYNSAFKGGKVSLSFFGDNYKSAEKNMRLQPKLEFPIASELIGFDFDIHYLEGSYEQNYDTGSAGKYKYANLGVTPNFQVLRDKLSVNLGAKLYYVFDLEQDTQEFKAYPNVNASFELVEEVLTFYAGATGGYTLNTYAKNAEENPYLSPDFNSIPTDEKYKFYGGLKGKLATNVSYLLSGSYAQVDNLAMYLHNATRYYDDANDEPYQYDNSFRMWYDNAKVTSLEGELSMDLSKHFTLGGNVQYHIYDLKNDPEAWNLPNLRATIYADLHRNQWQASAKLFMVDARKDMSYYYPIAQPFDSNYIMDHIITNKTYTDLNLSISYSFGERLSAFAKGYNLLNINYNRYAYYPVQGIQVMGGITYKFDL